MPAGPAGNWHMVENDQFAGAKTLPGDIHTNLAWGSSSAKGYGVETDTPGQDSLQADGLHMTWNPATHQSGAVSTAAQKGGTSGYYLQPGKDNFVQIRAQVPGGSTGWWPAFWLLAGGQGTWPWPPEIDIFEAGLGGAGHSQTFEGHFHQTNKSQQGFNLGTLTPGFHTFGFRLNPSEAVWYIDGKQVAASTNTANIADEFSHGGLYVVLNLGVGGVSGPAPTSAGTFTVSSLQGWTQ
jgi:hypothetical protein